MFAVYVNNKCSSPGLRVDKPTWLLRCASFDARGILPGIPVEPCQEHRVRPSLSRFRPSDTQGFIEARKSIDLDFDDPTQHGSFQLFAAHKILPSEHEKILFVENDIIELADRVSHDSLRINHELVDDNIPNFPYAMVHRNDLKTIGYAETFPRARRDEIPGRNVAGDRSTDDQFAVNASIHLRALLTDIFSIDEILKLQQTYSTEGTIKE